MRSSKLGRAITAFQAAGVVVIATYKDEPAGQAMANETGCRFLRVDVQQEKDWEVLAREFDEQTSW
jgi:hypothetical protein